MYLVAYDIRDGRLRTRFSKFLSRYGTRIQRSVFAIVGSGRVLEELRTGMEREFGRKFSQGDSVLAYNISESACVFRKGFPEDDLSDLVVR